MTQNSKKLFQHHRPAVLNLLLIIFIAVLALAYAFWANQIISRQYQAKVLKTKLSDLLEENNRLLSQKSDLANIGSLLFFSQQAGLVAQKNIEYIFDRNSLALERPPVGQAIP